MGRWLDSARELESLLRLRTFPLAIKRLKNQEDADRIAKVRRFDHRQTFCQVVGLCRTSGFTVVACPENMGEGCNYVLGLSLKHNWLKRVGVWFENKEAAEAQFAATPNMPREGHQAVVVAPLASEKFEPDIILVHGNPGQFHLLMCAYIYRDYFRWEFSFVGETACSDTIARAYNTGKPALSIPCYGQRRYGHVRDDELEMAIPPAMFDRGLEGLRWLSANGFRYPIPQWGTETDMTAGASVSYKKPVPNAKSE